MRGETIRSSEKERKRKVYVYEVGEDKFFKLMKQYKVKACRQLPGGSKVELKPLPPGMVSFPTLTEKDIFIEIPESAME